MIVQSLNCTQLSLYLSVCWAVKCFLKYIHPGNLATLTHSRVVDLIPRMCRWVRVSMQRLQCWMVMQCRVPACLTQAGITSLRSRIWAS